MPKRVGEFVEMTGRDGPVFIRQSDILRVVQKTEQTLVVCGSGKAEFVEDRAEAVMACLVPEKPGKFREAV